MWNSWVLFEGFRDRVARAANMAAMDARLRDTIAGFMLTYLGIWAGKTISVCWINSVSLVKGSEEVVGGLI